MSDRRVIANSQNATSAAKLPALALPVQGDWTSVLKWAARVNEHLQVRQGARGSALEQAVTHRDLQQTYGLRSVVTAGGKPGTILVQNPQGDWVALSAEHFAEMIRGSQLYRDLMRSINDPARFDQFGPRVKAMLLPDLGELAAKIGAAVRQVDTVVQSAGESFAARKTEITAAIDQHVAGVRQTLWAEANRFLATAGSALQLVARLDNVADSGATIEQLYSVVADSTEGLTAQAYLKLSAGGALAGWGASAEAPIGGTPTSYFIILANHFAIVDPGDTIGTGMGEIDPTNPPEGRIPFSVSGGVVRINGELEIGSSGQTLNDLASLGGIAITYTSQFFKVDSTGSPVNSSITLGIQFGSGLSGTVTWSAGAGYTGSVPSGTNTFTVDAGDQADDAVSYTADITIGGTDYTDTVTLVRLRDGTDVLRGLLSNENFNIPADASGAIVTYTGASGTFQVFRGSDLLADPDVAFSYVSSTGFSSAPSSSINATTGAYTITGNINAEVATVTYRATVGSATIDQVFKLSKVRQGNTGAAGTNAKLLNIIATSDIFSVAADGSTASPTSVTFSANGQNLSGSPTFAVVSGSGTATLSGGGGNVLQFADLATESVQVQVSQDGLTDTVTIAKVHAGSHAINVICPNQSHSLPADNAGTVSNYGGSGTTLQVYEGAMALTYVTGTPAAGQYNISKSVTTGAVTTGAVSGGGTTTATVADHSAMTTDVAVILYTISGKRADGSTFSDSITQTLTKSKTGAAGANGNDGTSYSLTANPSAIILSAAGDYSATNITFAAKSKTGGGTPANYAGRFKITTSIDGSTYGAADYTSGADENNHIFIIPAGKMTVKCEFYLAGGIVTKIDEMVVPIVSAGTDAVTPVVPNAAQALAASNAGVVSSYAGSGTTIQIYEGGTLLTFTTGVIADGKFTCGTPTVSPAGKITAGARSGNGTTTLTVADHSAMDNATDKVTITYPILVQKLGGAQVSLSLTQVITKSKAGSTGTTGTSGARGSLVGDGLYWGIRLVNNLWDDQLANRVIDNMVNGVTVGAAGSTSALASTAGNRVGDRVTLSDGPPWQACIGTLNSTGTWRNTIDFVPNQYVVRIVSSVPSIYRCIKANGPSGVGAQDPNSTTGYWQLLFTGAVARTTWAATTAYSPYDYLTDSGTVYFANFRHTSGSTSLSTDEQAQLTSITRTWTGLGWNNVVLYVDGNAVVTGQFSASIIYGGILSGMGINIGPGAEFQVDAATGNVTSTKFFGYCSQFGNTADPTKPAAKFGSYPGGSANTVEITLNYQLGASSGVALYAQSQGTAGTAHAIRGRWNKQGTSSDPGRGTNNAAYSSGLVGAANGNAFYAESGTIGPFTGSHECVILNDAEYDPGDIVVDTECVALGDLSNTLWHVERSSEARQVGAVGIIVYTMGPMNRQGLLAVAADQLTIDEETGIVSGPEWFETVKDQCSVASMNALGEGQMNICGEGGRELRGGDLIVTSSMPGKGMRLDPATPMTAELFACVVAKVRGKRSVVYRFNKPTSWKRIPVIFISG